MGTKVLHHQRWIYSMLDSINHRNLSRSRRGGQDICGVVIFRFANRFAYVISDDFVTVSQFFPGDPERCGCPAGNFSAGFCC